MACRIVSLHTQPLRIDLRGGGVLLLEPRGRSRALREELLYDNPFVAEWERAGLLVREPAPMSEVVDGEQAIATGAPIAKKTVAKTARVARRPGSAAARRTDKAAR